MKYSEKQLESSLKILAKTSAIVFIGVFLSKLFTYLYRIVIARYLGPEVYGIFSLAFIIISLAIAISSLGLGEGVMRYISYYRGKNERMKISFIFHKSLRIIFISSIFFALVLFLSSDIIAIKLFHNIDLVLYLKLFSLSLPFSVIGLVFIYTLRAFEKIKLYTLLNNVLPAGLRLLFISVIIFLGFKINAVIFSYVVSVICTFVIAFYITKVSLPKIFGTFKISERKKIILSRELFTYSWPIMVLGFINGIFYWIDSFTIGFFQDTYYVGLYNSAVPIVALLGIASELFMQLFFPLITKEYSKGNMELISQTSKQVSKWIFIINLPVFILLIFFPGAAINILFGSEYLTAESALRILAVGGFAGIFVPLLSNIISMSGRSKLLLSNIVIVSIFNLILNIILIPIYGINGAAFSTSLSWIILSVVLFFEVFKIAGFIPLRRRIFSIILSIIVPTTVLYLLKGYVVLNIFGLIMLVFLFLAIYILSILLFKGFDRNDLMIILLFKEKVMRK
jgi:O-antigen/teichoic acid export membrane protein